MSGKGEYSSTWQKYNIVTDMKTKIQGIIICEILSYLQICMHKEN